MADNIETIVGRAFGAALKASGFGRIHVNTMNQNIHFPCPLGTFSNSSTKGEQGCTQCTPGKICVLLVHQRISPMIVKYCPGRYCAERSEREIVPHDSTSFSLFDS